MMVKVYSSPPANMFELRERIIREFEALQNTPSRTCFAGRCSHAKKKYIYFVLNEGVDTSRGNRHKSLCHAFFL